MKKTDYVFQLAVYHKKEMTLKGYPSYKDLEKLKLKDLKNLFKEVL